MKSTPILIAFLLYILANAAVALFFSGFAASIAGIFGIFGGFWAAEIGSAAVTFPVFVFFLWAGRKAKFPGEVPESE